MSYNTLRPDPFFNREAELSALDRGWQRQRGGQMAVVYGRRRLGKTYLLQRFFTDDVRNGGEPKPHCYYLAEQSTAEVQRLSLARRLLDAFPAPRVAAEEIAVSWNALLRYLSQQANRPPASSRRIALILDEFPYLVAQTPEMPSILQAWWDQEGVHLPLHIVLCGSQLSVMASLGRESAPLYGRFNAGIIRVEPLRYDDVAAFYEDKPLYGRTEKLLMYGVLGGTPRYHAMVDTDRPPDAEIVSLLMQPSAVLESEVRYLLSSEQIRDPAPYNAILDAIASGRTQYGAIQQATGIETPALAHPLRTLLELGWIRREVSFGEQSERRALYRIADPFLHFWYRFVLPLGSALQFSDPTDVFQSRVAPYLNDYMGWSLFEGICMQWLQKHARGVLGVTIQKMGRYWSRDGRTEIDIAAELDDGTLLFGECKWSAAKPVGFGVYAELRAKVSSLPNQHWRDTASYVLLSLGGFTPELRTHAASDRGIYLVDGSQLL